MTTRAKELADRLRERFETNRADLLGLGYGPEIVEHLDRLAAIDSAAPGEVREIAERLAGVRALPWASQAERYLSDIATLLAIVQRQAQAIASHERELAAIYSYLKAEFGEHDGCAPAAVEAALNQRDEARAEVERLTECLRMMQHGESEALKMMGTEKQRADNLSAEVERYSQREIAYTHIEAPAEKLPAPLACPNCDRRDSWREFLGNSGLMRCEKEEGGCGYSMSLDANEPENLRQARDLLRQEKSEANAEILRLRAEASKQRERADVLADGVRLYRERCEIIDGVADQWEHKHGHLVGDGK